MADILYNIKKVVVEELDSLTGLPAVGAPSINITCDSTADINPVVAKGEEKVLRDDVHILAVARSNELVYGYDVKLTNTTFDVNFAALIEGGTIRKEGEVVVGYDAPKLADGDSKVKEFRMTIYVENYEGDNIKNYAKITFNKCIGQAPKMVFKKDFYAPEFEIQARENTKADLTVKSIDYVDAVPSDDVTAPTVTMVSTGTITKPAPVIAKSSEIGALYLIPSGTTASTATELNTLVNVGLGALASVVTIAAEVSIATTGLTAGAYKVHAVDKAGNVSAGSAITLA